MAELALIRTAQGLVPATEADRETVQKWKAGQVVHGKFTRMRNAKFHGKFFAMLDLAWGTGSRKVVLCRARRCVASAGWPNTSRI